jgi:dynein assembly factor 3, axonemal
MLLKEFAPIIHFYHYREWRQSGVAFESRFSTYPTPNRTLSSYLPGKKKGTHESCLVRGYWGDIIMSPYLAYGISTDVLPEKQKLFKVHYSPE